MTHQSENKYTEVLLCGHCNNRSPMEICATHTDTKIIPETKINPQLEELAYYQLLLCPACRMPILRVYWSFEDEEMGNTILYPNDKDNIPSGLPKPIRKAYEAALNVRAIDVNAFAVLIGRVLEMVCEDRQAGGRSLHEKLTDLSIKGEIPNKLVGIADSLRNLRNVGAHAGLGDLTNEEVPILTSLCEAILDYIYTAPYLVTQAEERLATLKVRSAVSKATSAKAQKATK